MRKCRNGEWKTGGQTQHQKDLTMGESDPEVTKGKRLLSLNHIGLGQAQLPYEKSENIGSQQSH